MTQAASGTRAKSGNAIIDYFADFAVLRETRMEYWGIQIVNFLDSTMFFAILTIAVVMLSENFGFSDKNAGYVVTLYGSTTTLCLFASGAITDALGIRWSFYISQAGLLLTRAAIVFAAFAPGLTPDTRGVFIVVAFGLMAPFVAMVQTTFQAANKRFTTKRSRSAGFNLWYLFMNVGAALGGYMIDIVRIHMGVSNVHIFTISCATAFLCMVITGLMVHNESQLTGPDEPAPADNQNKRRENAKAFNDPAPAGSAPKKRGRNPVTIFLEVLSEPTLWKLMVLIGLLLGVRAVFLYMHLLMPKFWLRVIGPEAKIGFLEAINPILVIIGLILLIPVLHRFKVYSMLVYGSMVSALALFVLAIPAHGQTVYYTSIAALFVLTVGEVIWSPRLQEYTAAIAPEGQEGVYLGLSMIPYFVAKTIVSLLSGHMLDRWCPEFPEGEPSMGERIASGTVTFWDSPSAMWLILGIVGLLGAMIALALRGWFTRGAHFERHAASH